MIIGRVFKLIFIVSLVIGGIVTVMSIPFTKDVLSCYDQNTKAIDDIQSSALGYGWDGFKVCQAKSEAIGILEMCISEANSGSSAPDGVKTFILDSLPNIRPYTLPVEKRKLRHDEECSEYRSTQFYPVE